MKDIELARHIAGYAGRLLLQVQESSLFEGQALGRVGDRVSNAFIMEALRCHRPDDAILSEEEKDDADRLRHLRVWIVDPLDGTREFGERRTDWAVHVALSVDGHAALGAVALPGLALVLDSGSVSAPAPREGRLRMVVSRTRPAAEAVAVARGLDAELIPMGSAGAKAMAILRNEADIYLHSGGQYEWDSCAPAAVARAAGLHVSRLDGSELRYNQRDTLLPDLLVCRQECAEAVRQVLRSLAAVSG